MLKGLTGKTALVTGAAAGIGAATCRRLHSEGVNVVAEDRGGGGLVALAANLGDRIVTVVGDVSAAADTERFFDTAVEHFGSIDLFHANAGIDPGVVLLADLDMADFDRIFAVNVRGAFLGARAAVRRMSTQPGRGNIVFTSSVAGLKGDAGVAVDVASKHAVNGLAKSMAKEIGHLGIRVNVVCPGPTQTSMMDRLEVGIGNLGGADAEGVRVALATVIPLGRYAEAEEIAATVAWLLSDEVPYMHGEIVTVGGGLYP
ncbi:SDR family oxidoreductase [Aeromicrobium sp.]|uniref:SDR family NAD(P)-dependent oxidoreductase n=1 Tax=Aeromicrobium sp. TaxID=1871063 RepID=UPI00198AC578|nr:SDR family oxidoreductase [Aeromicrobium sp.]MBC7631459.1 SDR family oxidoreductase [Aeromicrobium sp.]